MIPANIQAFFKKNQEVLQTRADQVQKVETVNACVRFKSFPVFNPTTGRNDDESMCPVMTKTKPNKEGKTYPKKLAVDATLLSITEVPRLCRRDEHDPDVYHLLADVDFSKDARTWLQANVSKLHDTNDGVDSTLEPWVKREMAQYVIPIEGAPLADKRWIKVRVGQNVRIKFKDEGEKSIFRAKTDGERKDVRRGVRLNLAECQIKVYLFVPSGGASSAGGEDAPDNEGDKKVPRAAISIQPKGLSLAEGERGPGSLADKLRATLDLDAHTCVPIMDILQADQRGEPAPSIPNNATFYVRHNYMTPHDPENPADPNMKGIVSMILPPTDGKDLVYTSNDGVFPRVIRRVQRLQFTGSVADGYDSFMIVLRGLNDKLYRNFGIPDVMAYSLIYLAHYDMDCFMDASFWQKRTLQETPANTEEALRNDVTKTKGYYTYIIDDVTPDPKPYLERGGAIQISKNKLKELFDQNLREDVRRGTSLVLDCKGPVNMWNTDGKFSSVLMLGNPQDHQYSGDAWPMIENGSIYVLSSVRPTDAERATICGANADLDAADARFDQLLNTEGFKYVLCVVQDFGETTPMRIDPPAAAVDPSETVTIQEAGPITKKKKKKAAKSAEKSTEKSAEKKSAEKKSTDKKRKKEEVEDVSSLSSSEEDDDDEEEEEEEEEPTPPPPKKTKKKKAKKE